VRADQCYRGALLLTLLLICLVSTPATAKRGDHSKSCSRIETQIVKYTKLRRSGGSARQMDKWHRKRNQLKRRYSELSCKR